MCLSVCVSVCLSVTTITKKIVDGFVPNFMGRFLRGKGRPSSCFVTIGDLGLGSILRFTDPPTQRTRDIVRRIASQSPSSLPDRHVGTVSMLVRCRRSCIHQERVSSGFQASDGTRHGLPTDHQRHQLTPMPGAEPLDTAS